MPEMIQDVLARLESKKLLVPKTKEESNYARWKKGDDDPTVVAGKSENEADCHDVDEDLAWAVDLGEWKLGKPVVRKPGAHP